MYILLYYSYYVYIIYILLLLLYVYVNLEYRTSVRKNSGFVYNKPRMISELDDDFYLNKKLNSYSRPKY